MREKLGKLGIALGLVPVLMAAMAAGSSAAPGYERQKAQQHPLVQGKDAKAAALAPDPDEEAAKKPVPEPVWPGAEAITARAGTLPVGVQSLGRRGDYAMVLKLGATKEKTSKVSVDYSKFRTAFGADYGNRLKLVSLPDCALSTPDKQECAGTQLASANDGTRVTGEAPSGGLVALAAAPEGSTGDFKATDLKAAGKWEAGGSSGDFTWSYPLRFPPAIEGPAPEFGLDYSAQAVDGQTAATNNQPSWVGEGFSFSPGYIERSYRSCADDMGNGALNTTKTGDLCWFSDNAVMSLGGRTVELIQDGEGLYHSRAEAGLKIEHRTGAVNGDDNGEHWVVTDQNGVQHWFGRQRIPGWVAGKPETQSVFTVPVFGNHKDEPCKQTTWAASSCNQAWRWNLDYVVDPHGNSMSLWYTKETNKYALNLDLNKSVDYVRGGYLTRIDYGTRSDAEFGSVPAQVKFDVWDRCEANCGTKNATTWKDVPWDLECTGAACKTAAPTFWTTKRLGKITTLSGGRAVDAWTLRHSYPDPGDNTRAGLWLEGIKHTGLLGGTVDLPETTFTGEPKPNRVHGFGTDAPAMNWRRISRIRNELGGEIAVSYSDPECVAGTKMPGAPESNTLRCFPAYWTRTGNTDPTIDYFHKYVVTAVSEVDNAGLAPVHTTSYEYLGGGAWHYADDDGITPDKYKTWNSWRGYEKVRVTDGSGEGTRYGLTQYFRGMDGDRLPNNGRRSVQLRDSEDGLVDDSPGLEGRPREKRTFNGPGGTEISGEIYDQWRSAPTATRNAGGSVAEARFVDERAKKHRIVLDNGRGFLRTEVTTDFDEKTGKPTVVNDRGDITKDDDDQCTRTDYVQNESKWLIGLVSRERTYSLSCDKNPTTEEEIVGDTRTSYDGGVFGAAPSKGEVTRTEEVSGFVNGVYSYTTTERATYDVHGREKESWDERDAKTTTTYTPATGGPVTGMTTVNALNHKTVTVLEPAWEDAVLSITDPNNKVTSRGYDALGRLTGVWKPGRTKGSSGPHLRFSYTVRNTAASSVTTEELHPDDVRYVATTELYDGFGRARQKQAPAQGGGRIISDTIYDPAGRVTTENPGYPVAGAPNTNLFVALADNEILNQKVTKYDPADRKTAEIVKSHNVEQRRTGIRYGGDRIDVTPPAGGTATTTITDGRDRKIELWEYSGAQPTGDHQATKYTYTKKNQEATVVDTAGNTWTYGYDIRGRRTSETDPDTGTTTTTYTKAGDKETVTGATGPKLVYDYDVLGRRIGLYEDSLTGTKRAEWTYDTTEAGQPARSTRFQDGKAYSTEVTGYDGQYQPVGTKITIPDTPATPAGKLAGTYEFRNTYKANGDLATTTYPKAAGLDTEVVEYNYDDQGSPSVLKSKVGLAPQTTYVAGTQYTNLAQPGVYTFATSNTGKMVETGYTYNDDGKLAVTKTTKELGTALVAEVRNSFDPAGNVTKVQDGADTQCFGYDSLRRMKEAWTPSSGDCAAAPRGDQLGGPAKYWESFAYDAVGNRRSRVEHATSKGDVTTTYDYPAAGSAKPHTLSGTTTKDNTGTRTASYAYDEVGNTKSRPGTDGEQKLTWDAEGNLAASEDAKGKSSFVDDSDGNRMVRSDASGTTLFLPNVQIRLDKASGGTDSTRFYDYGGHVVAQRDNGGVTWLVADQQGTVNISVTESGQTVDQRRQTPFGQERGQTASWPNGYGFLFGAKEPGGLTNVGVRQYDSETGRFTSADPLVDADTPQQMHGYAYANNSPVTFTDPTGESWGDAVMGGSTGSTTNWGNAVTGGGSRGGVDNSAREIAQAKARAAQRAAAARIAAAARAAALKKARMLAEMFRRAMALRLAKARAIAAAAEAEKALEAEAYRKYKEKMKPINDFAGDAWGSYFVAKEFAGGAIVSAPTVVFGAAFLSLWKIGDRTAMEWMWWPFQQAAKWFFNEVTTPAAWWAVTSARKGARAFGTAVRQGVRNFKQAIPSLPGKIGGALGKVLSWPPHIAEPWILNCVGKILC
ncbi:RHS repeat-associated core domain-containing protein [Lentzea sp. NPDC006480]|uniref:RHS repeat domain-containing protein n=1 Tax=Lentzea sp. NPDC006480 TaxID=3157176 RepID=UPI0033AFA8FB